MTTTSQRYLLKHTRLTHSDSYSTIGPYAPEPKTRVELCMIRASAAIRSTSDWVEQLHSDSKCSEWAAQVKKAFGLNRRETKYVFDELEYYAKLMANGRQGEEPGAVDMVWINRGGQDDQLAAELARNAELLEDDYTKECCGGLEGRKSFGRQVLVDPFLYAFSSDESQAFKKPITSPMEAVNSEVPRISPGVFWKWEEAIKIVNEANSQSKNKAFDKRKISWLDAEPKTEEGKLYASCWLPTDFDVGVDGLISMRSYINNLHPVHHAELYQTISKVFTKCVPMLEQALTDAIHPHQSRDVFDESLCFKYGTPHPHDILQIVEKGEPLPDKYKKFVTSSDSYCYGGKWNDTLVVNGIEIDTSALFNEWEKSRPATRFSPSSTSLPFSPLYRPTVPYSVRGLPLQASVEMARIILTPDNPSYEESEWQTVGRDKEGTSAICLYFYDVENIANAKLMFRDPVKDKTCSKLEQEATLYNANTMADYSKKCNALNAIGGDEIKTGRFICFPNLYQTKLSSIQLEDPTKKGHVKYIAFYIVDPSYRRVSTEIVPPRQPSWAQTAREAANATGGSSTLTTGNNEARTKLMKALEERDELERKHKAYYDDIYCPCMWHKKLPNVKAPVWNMLSSIRHFLSF